MSRYPRFTLPLFLVLMALSAALAWRQTHDASGLIRGFIAGGAAALIITRERERDRELKAAKNVARAAARAALARSRWIPVSSGLPEPARDIFVLHGNTPSVGTLMSYGGWDSDLIERVGTAAAGPVTHWIPIPPLPEEVT